MKVASRPGPGGNPWGYIVPVRGEGAGASLNHDHFSPDPNTNARIRTGPFVIAVLMLVLAGCAGRLPAPVDSRVDEVPTRKAALESSASAPGVVVATSEASQSLDPIPAPTPVSTDGDIASPETPAAAEMTKSAAIAPKRLAALNPAIKELLNDANRHSAEGRHDGAAAALERALQIEPEDAALWHRLARTRLNQGRAGLAEALAAKSNSLAAGDPNLQAQNWRVIAKARKKQGDAPGAEDALARAARLAQ